MTKKEAAQILAILKAAYPNSYKNMTVEEANGTATVWSIQFAKFPVKLVYIAVNKWISTNQFPPSISEVKKQISFLYWEAWHILDNNKRFHTLTEAQAAEYEQIYNIASTLREGAATELSLEEILDNAGAFLLGDGKGGE